MNRIAAHSRSRLTPSRGARSRSVTPSLRHSGTSRPAFTLAELIVATIMLSILVSSTYISISQTLRARDRSQSRADAFGRASAAADLIAADAQSTLRDADLTNCRIAIVRSGKPGAGQDGVLLFSHLNRTVRAASEQAEGNEAEVEFRLQPGEKPDAVSLWRRTAPTIDEYPDAGGVATALVDGIKGVNIQASNGTDWLDDWDSDNDGLPYALRISVTGMDDSTKETATVRRIIAMDRVPLPSEMEAAADATSTATTAAAAAPANTNTNTNAGGNNGGGGGRNLGGNGGGGGRGGGGQGGGGQGGGGQGGGRGNGNGGGGQGGGRGGGGPGQGGGGQGGGGPGTGQGGGGPRGGGGGGGGGTGGGGGRGGGG